MKRIFKILFFWGLISYVYSQGTYATDEYFEGSITYVVEYEGAMADFWRNNEVPTSMTIHIKDGSYIIHLYNSRFPTTMLYVNDSDQTYILDLAQRRAFTKSKIKIEDKPPKAVPTGDTLTVAGYFCKGYKVTKKDETILYFVSDAIRVNLEYFKGKRNAKAFFLTEGLDGRIPLKMIRKFNRSTVITTAVKINRRKYKAVQFTLPPDITILGYDFRR